MSKVMSENQIQAGPRTHEYEEFDWIYLNNQFSYLVGRVKTVIDASIADKQQNKALKDLLAQEIWKTMNNFLEDPKGEKQELPVPMEG